MLALMSVAAVGGPRTLVFDEVDAGIGGHTIQVDKLASSAQHGFTLSRVETVVSTDLSRQTRVIRSIYEAVDERGQIVAKRFVEWPYRWTHRFEAEHLLARCGFEVEAIYGGYGREAFTADSATMVFLARRRHSIFSTLPLESR